MNTNEIFIIAKSKLCDMQWLPTFIVYSLNMLILVKQKNK